MLLLLVYGTFVANRRDGCSSKQIVISTVNGDMIIADSSVGSVRAYHTTGHHRFSYMCPDGSADALVIDKSGKLINAIKCH